MIILLKDTTNTEIKTISIQKKKKKKKKKISKCTKYTKLRQKLLKFCDVPLNGAF